MPCELKVIVISQNYTSCVNEKSKIVLLLLKSKKQGGKTNFGTCFHKENDYIRNEGF